MDANINLNQIMDMLSGAGGVGLVAYGLFSRAMREWENLKALITKALNDVAEIKNDRSRCRPAHDKAILETETDIDSLRERVTKLEAILQQAQQHSQTQTIKPEYMRHG